MKVRIGVGVGAGALGRRDLSAIVDGIAAWNLDSLWLSEVLTGAAVDPLVGLAVAAGRHDTIKLGTTMLLPGRNPLRLAKALAGLDQLSEGRLLITFVPGLGFEPERSAIGLPADRRGAALDVVLPLLRQLWSGDPVTWSGAGAGIGLDQFALERVTVSPLPLQDPLEVWLGGMAPAALRRCGRLGDGWLPSLCTPDTAAAGREVIDAEAAASGREISDEHFGVSLGYSSRPLSERARAALASRARGADPDALVPVGWDTTRTLLERFVAAGFSKFVLRPLDPPADWGAELEAMAAAVGDLQT